MWKQYFKFVKLKPGRVITALFGELDFSQDNIPIGKIKALYESDFPYLQITDEGQKELYGIDVVTEPVEVITDTFETLVTELDKEQATEPSETPLPKRTRTTKTRKHP